MLYTILVCAVTFLYLVLLELSKNMIVGWVIGIALVAAMIAARIVLKKKGKVNAKGKPSKKILALFWLGFILLLAGNYKLTAPPVKNTPAVANSNPKVTDVIHVNEGDLTGVYNADGSVAVYAGIPFAKPPVGGLRFRAPQPAEKWEGVKACDCFAAMPMQVKDSPLKNSLQELLIKGNYQMKIGDEYIHPMSEDCLYLNVFVPEGYQGEKLPVIFYVYGGSFNSGDSQNPEFRGEDLAKQGVIFVSTAYRTGVFGLYAADDLKPESENKESSGNYALMDQIQALKWVRDNIASFGGDPDRITIAGESAGSISINALCVSPLTEGMFQYAIAESGGILAHKPYMSFITYDMAKKEGDSVRAEFNVSSSDELRSIPADKLNTSQMQKSACSLTLDGYVLTEMPYQTYEKGNNHEKALLNGFNGKEADLFLITKKVDSGDYLNLLKPVLGDYAEEMAKLVPADTPQRSQHVIVDKLGDAKGAADIVYSAVWFSYSHYLWNNYMTAQNRPSYEYLFNKENRSKSDYHAGELAYIYGNLWRYPSLYGESDKKLSDTMVKYAANFVKTGDPNGDGLPEWEKYSSSGQLLQLNDEIRMMDDPNNELYKVIDKFQNTPGGSK